MANDPRADRQDPHTPVSTSSDPHQGCRHREGNNRLDNCVASKRLLCPLRDDRQLIWLSMRPHQVPAGQPQIVPLIVRHLLVAPLAGR